MSEDTQDYVIAEINWSGFGCWPKFVLEKVSNLLVQGNPIRFQSSIYDENGTPAFLSKNYILDEDIHNLIIPCEEYIGYVLDSLMEEFILQHSRARHILIFPTQESKQYVQVNM